MRKRIDLALADDVAIPLDAQASRHELVAGENFSVDVSVAGVPAVPVKWTLNTNSILVPSGWSVTPEGAKGASEVAKFNVAIPGGATANANSRRMRFCHFRRHWCDWRCKWRWRDIRFAIERPVNSMEATTTGIQTYPLELVPAVTLTVEPKQVMAPEKRAAMPVKLFARVRYHGTAAAKVTVGLEAPKGWAVQTPNVQGPLEFAKGGDRLIQFVVTAPAETAAGAYTLHPFARIGEETFRTSLEPIPTLPTRNWSEPADATVHVLNLTVPAGLRVGYIAAENDTLPEILRQIGIRRGHAG